MTHLKSYLGSIVLAGLLLQGCGSDSSSTTAPIVEDNTPSQAVVNFNTVSSVLSSDSLSSEDSAQALSDLTLKIASLDANNADVRAYIDSIVTENDATRAEAYQAVAEAVMGNTDSVKNAPRRGILGDLTSGLTDAVGDGLVDILDTSVGDAITTASFDVVLNSEGVTIVMIDLARNSETTSEIMVNSMEADWSLAEKMCPMLRESTEFGEKFTALAEEMDVVGRFFFERIDANMYGCLTDAMLLSNNDAVHDESVKYSTNGYMALLMDRYATDYFIMPTGSTEVRRNDKFVSLMLDTGAIATYDATTKEFTGHGDGNELINEKFFYSLFKTPTSTDSFVSAMEKIDPAVAKMLMDNIFLGQPVDANATPDTMQGYLNIIAIGSAMYDGIYGEQDENGVRTNAYGFGSYMGGFVGFAGLIPNDRYMTYGKAFINAGYQYAEFHGINVWTGVSDAAKYAWDAYTGSDETNTTDTTIAQSGGLGVTGSDWYDDTMDLMKAGWAYVSLSNLWDSLMDGDKSVTAELKDQASVAYDTVIDGRDANGTLAYPTEITNPTTVKNDTVYGFHGLIELAMQEDIFYVNCGNRATDYLVGEVTCDNNASYTFENAKETFTLPPFSDLTMSFVYNSAKDGAVSYFNTNVDAAWLADLSNNELIRKYFYPSADNVYIPSWMLAIDWLAAPDALSSTNVETTDFDFNAGYFDIYVTSTNDDILVPGSSIDITVALNSIKSMEVTRVEMGSDDIIAVDENGQTLDGLYVYKIRTISPEDTQAVLDYLGALGDKALSAVGLDSSNASTVDTTNVDSNTTAQ